MVLKLKMLNKFAPESGSGKVRNITTALRLAGSGIGFTAVANTVDTLLLKGTMNSIGFNIPVIGIRMSLIDVGNFLAHNGGSIMPKSIRPIIAVGSAKVIQGAIQLPSLGAGNVVSGGASQGASV